MRKWNTIAIMVLMSCGEQPSSVRTEYYIEEPTPEEELEEKENAGSDASGKKTTNDPTALNLSFNTPDGADANGIITIEVEIKNANEDATWSVSYSSKEDGSSPKVIDQDLPVTKTSVEWDVSSLGAGTFYLIGEITTDGKTEKFQAPNPIELDESGNPTNGKPTIQLDFPLGENVFVVGTPQNIRWTSTDPDDDAMTYKIEYSADGGANWTMVADEVKVQTYAWSADGLSQGITYKVRVTAKDAKGATNSATSTKNFGVATAPMTFATGFGAMLTQRCAACHAMGRVNQGVFRSDNYDLATIGVSDKMNNIKTRIENDTMPPGGAGLGAADKEILTMWLWGGGQ